MAFIDIRDRYGITQLAFNDGYNPDLLKKACEIGREFVIQAVELLDDEQRLLTRRVINAVQQERIERVRMNQPFGRQQILDTIERVVRENIGAIARNSGGGRGYYKRYTRKKISNRK
jgi:aspartyl-tRNA synthetase